MGPQVASRFGVPINHQGQMQRLQTNVGFIVPIPSWPPRGLVKDLSQGNYRPEICKLPHLETAGKFRNDSKGLRIASHRTYFSLFSFWSPLCSCPQGSLETLMAPPFPRHDNAPFNRTRLRSTLNVAGTSVGAAGYYASTTRSIHSQFMPNRMSLLIH